MNTMLATRGNSGCSCGERRRITIQLRAEADAEWACELVTALVEIPH
jgi:hypothetical protein